MTYQIEMIEDNKAMLVTNEADFDFSTEGALVIRDVMARLNALNEAVFYVVDLRLLDISFDDTLTFVNMLTRGDNPLLHHRNIREIVYIVGSDFQKMIAEGLSADMFGNLHIQIFAEMEDALEYIRGN